MTEQTASKPSTLAPFRYPAFRAIWTASLASNMGAMIQSVSAGWLMTELTSSNMMIALVQAGASIPILLLGVFAGAIADNFDRRRVMLAAQTGMLLVSAALAIITWLDAISPLLLLLLTLAVGCGTALNGPAWQASVRLQVGHKDLPQAIALNTIAFNLARSVGPAIGGLLISLAGPAVSFTLNSFSYVFLIIVLLRWNPEVTPPQRSPMLSAIATGLRFCRQSSPLRRILLRGFSFGLGAACFQALLPSMVKEGLGAGELSFGLCLAAFGVGSIITALRVASLREKFGNDWVVTIAAMLFAAALIPYAFAHTLSTVMAAAFIAGGAWVATLTTLNVAMQLRSPDAILGRCLSIYQAITFGAMAFGAWIAGSLADIYSLQTAIFVSAGWLVVSSFALHEIAPMPEKPEPKAKPSSG